MRGAGAHRDGDARTHDVDLATGDDALPIHQLVDRFRRQEHKIERLAGLHALRRIDTTDGFDHHLDTMASRIIFRHMLQHEARRHR